MRVDTGRQLHGAVDGDLAQHLGRWAGPASPAPTDSWWHVSGCGTLVASAAALASGHRPDAEPARVAAGTLFCCCLGVVVEESLAIARPGWALLQVRCALSPLTPVQYCVVACSDRYLSA
jgi:hypothetical protein